MAVFKDVGEGMKSQGEEICREKKFEQDRTGDSAKQVEECAIQFK